MRTAFLLLLSVAASSAFGADLRLVPAPRSARLAGGELRLSSPVRIAVLSGSAEDRFAAEMLREEIRSTTGADARFVQSAPDGPAVVIARTDASVGGAGPALRNREGYVLEVTPRGARLSASTAEGVFYGVQTLRQMVRRGQAGVSLPLVAIADWPALPVRGLMIDTSQGAVLSADALKRAVRTVAEYKLNLINLYVEHVFPFSHSPLTAEGAALGFDEMRDLVAYAKRYHVDVVPQQQTFGHLHSLLKWELYSGMAETPRGDVLAAGDARGYAWALEACKQLASVFPSRYLHIGSDETFELGRGRSKELVERQGMGRVYTDHMHKMDDLLRPLKRKLIYWGDIAKRNPEAIKDLPKDMIVATWTHKPDDDFPAFIAPFREAGLETWVSPGVNNWRRMFPNFTDAAANINGLVGAGKKMGITGALNSYWNDQGEEFFNLTWYGIVFGAAASWQPDSVDVAAFDRAFDWAFYRADGDTFIRANRNLSSVNSLLQSKGLGEADNNLFWTEPFSQRGAESIRKLLPVAPEIRKRAEESMVLLQTDSHKARLHRETIPFLQFAARHLDAFGLKVEMSKDIADFYRAALAHNGDAQAIGQDLREIMGRSGVGRAQDVLDAVAELKVMVRNLWPAENRPYYLESLLVRYDAEMQYWLAKRRLFQSVRSEGSGRVPPPETLGLVLP